MAGKLYQQRILIIKKKKKPRHTEKNTQIQDLERNQLIEIMYPKFTKPLTSRLNQLSKEKLN